MARQAEARTYGLEPLGVQPQLLREDLPAMLAGRVVPATFFLLTALARIQELSLFVSAARVNGDWLASAGFYAACVDKVAAIAFLGLTVTFFVIRLNPVRSSRQPLQIIVALLGSFLMTVVAMAAQTPTGPVFTIISALIMLSGSIFTLVALRFLGRSFSITPEARKLVTGGLYSIVRHPMYLGEILGSLGMLLQALSPFTCGIFLAFCALQIKRMDYEESILQRAFPDYRLYKMRTARLIPGIY